MTHSFSATKSDYIRERLRGRMLHPAYWVPFLLAGAIWGALWAARLLMPGSCSSVTVTWVGGILVLLGAGAGLATTPPVLIFGGGLGAIVLATGLILVSTGHC